MTSRLQAYRVTAYNTSKQSENKIHDDTVARRFGFSGGLVPGVDVMAYMMHLARWRSKSRAAASSAPPVARRCPKLRPRSPWPNTKRSRP